MYIQKARRRPGLRALQYKNNYYWYHFFGTVCRNAAFRSQSSIQRPEAGAPCPQSGSRSVLRPRSPARGNPVCIARGVRG